MSALDKFYDFTLNLPDAKLTSKAMSLCNIDRNVFNIYLTLQEGKNNPILNADLGNYTVTMIVVKPKTKEYVEKVGVVDGSNDRLLFELGDTFNDQIGSYKGEIKVQNGNEVITSSSFAYTVTQSLISGLNAEIEASPDVEILRQLINEVKAVVGMTPEDPDSLLTEYQKKTDNTLTTTEKEIPKAINEVNSQIKDKANQIDLEIERNRITNLAKLSEGSTTGDAELIDARIGADGITYNTLGDSIRTQFGNNNTDINNIINSFPNELLEPKIDEHQIDTVLGACSNTGEFSDKKDRRVTDYIDLREVAYFGITEELKDTRQYWIRIFDENKSFLGNGNSGRTTNETFYSQDIISKFPTAVYVVMSIKSVPITNMTDLDGGVVVGKYGALTIAYSLEEYFTSKYDTYVIKDTLKLEKGGIDKNNGNFQYGSNIEHIRTRSPLFIEVLASTELTLHGVSSDLYIFEYDENFTYLKKTLTSTGVNLSDTTKYIKFGDDNGLNTEVTYSIIANDIIHNYEYGIDMKPKYVKNPRTSEINEKFFYKLNGQNDYFTSGLLKLPPNYTVDGESVPLIVFAHGSADYQGIGTSKMTNNYMDYYDYLRDNGYAIFDCWGWSTKYATQLNKAGSSTWGTPTNMNAYISGIEFVLEHFNLDKNKIFATGKSLGGIMGISLAFQNKIKINACGLLAPSLNPLNSLPGYTQKERVVFVDDLGFTGDTENIIDVDDSVFDPKSDEYLQYMKDNAEKLAGYNPYWRNTSLPLETKVENSVKYKDGSRCDYSNVSRICNVPIKIWVADDDVNVRPNAIKNFIRTLKNGGCIGEVRTMPSGTGGHHSVDNDANAPKVESIVTKLGITCTDVPVAYVELLQYFEENL